MSGNRLRWAIFTVSIVSSVDNPSAHFWRVMGRRLRQRENVAIFFETRGNRAVQALLRRERSVGLSAFRERYPDIHYQTVEQQSGYALAEWLTRTLATVDVALVDRDASPELITALSDFSRPFLQTFLVDPGWNTDSLNAEPLPNFSGILAGNDTVQEAYAASSDPARVYPFGPLPVTLPDGEPAAEDDAVLNDAAAKAITTIMRVSEKIRSARGTQFVANGRADHTNHSTSHEPN